MIKKLLLWWLPLIILIVITPFASRIDLSISNYFFIDGHFINNFWTKAIFHYALIPAWIVFLGAITILFIPHLKPWRPAAWLLILSFVIGGGLIINFTLKDHWGRPRPREVKEFGGSQQYLPYYQPNFSSPSDKNKSFPSGHASAGFYFLAFCVLGRHYRSRQLLIFGIASTIVMGTLLGGVRIVQGGHFFSDVLMSAIIMWYTPLLLDKIIWRYRERYH
ncbi:MAG: phosphatase PAP2 family protein [Chlamydiota bacterium]